MFLTGFAARLANATLCLDRLNRREAVVYGLAQAMTSVPRFKFKADLQLNYFVCYVPEADIAGITIC